MKFQDVKLNDTLIYTHSYGMTGKTYTFVTVTKVTKTRFTTVGKNESERVWTKDGHEYPSNKERWRMTHEELHHITPELQEDMRKDGIKKRFMHTVKILGDHGGKHYNALTEEQVLDFNKHAALVLNIITGEVTK